MVIACHYYVVIEYQKHVISGLETVKVENYFFGYLVLQFIVFSGLWRWAIVIGTLRQAIVALNVWQPEIVRGRQKQIVEQCVVPAESRLQALEMELKLCKQQIAGFERAYVSVYFIWYAMSQFFEFGRGL